MSDKLPFLIIGISISVIGFVGMVSRDFPAPYGYFIDFGEFHVILGALFICLGFYIVITTFRKKRRQKD